MIAITTLLQFALLSVSSTGSLLAFGFSSPPQYRSSSILHRSSTTSLHATVTLNDIASVGYVVKINKPLGLILGENENSLGGVVVEDVADTSNGAVAGIRAGDQLLSINNDIVMGDAFETVMGLLKSGQDPLELRLYRGPVEELYQRVFQTNDLDDFVVEDEMVVMDENYESPVVVPVNEDDTDGPITAGQVMNAFKKLAAGINNDDDKSESGQKAKEKRKGGLFGGMFSGETVQLDGDDASTLN